MNKLVFKILVCCLFFGCTVQFVLAKGEAHFAPSPPKQYKQMSQQEQVDYVRSRLMLVAQQMTKNAERGFPDEAIVLVKYWLDAYVRRIRTGNTRLWAEDLRFTFKRAATNYTPTIIATFEEQQVPILLGVYIPMIESEYRNIASENVAGAVGLFQWIAPTAREYGVHPSERTNIEKMAPVAARYLKERFAEFGADITGIELAIHAYNRSPKSVMRDLKQFSDGKEKPTFWTFVKNKEKMDKWFQEEDINHVPRFYAVAIIGENPTDFGIEMKPLSTYTKQTPSLI